MSNTYKKYTREYIEKIRNLGVKVITNPEQVYWHDMMTKSICCSIKKDCRQRGVRKPIIIEADYNYIVEWDYTEHTGWIAYNDRGDIIGTSSCRGTILMKLYFHLRCVNNG